MKKKFGLLMTIILSMLFLVACGGSGDKKEAATGANTGKDTLVIGQGADAKSLDPHASNDNPSSNIRVQIYDRLMDLDENGVPQPMLAESWERPDDKTIIFHLRKGVKFHNGDEMKASDVKFSLERALASPEVAEIISGIKSIKNKIGTFGGADLETDTELRERYLERIDRKTSFTTEGIKNYILQNTNVKKCQVLENDTDDFDAEGRVAHSYEAICFGDTDENILQALYEYKLAGIRAVGDITKQFEEISVGFSRAIEKQIFLKVEITTIKEVWKDEFKKVINNIFINYLSEIEPAGTIYLYKLIGEIYKHTSGIKTLRLKLGDTKYSERETDYILSKKEVAIGNENNVTIVVTS